MCGELLLSNESGVGACLVVHGGLCWEIRLWRSGWRLTATGVAVAVLSPTTMVGIRRDLAAAEGTWTVHKMLNYQHGVTLVS